MTAAQKDRALAERIWATFPPIPERKKDPLMRGSGQRGFTIEEANTLRRAQLTLHRWAEMECGTRHKSGSYAEDLSIERGEDGKPMMRRQWISSACPQWQEETRPIPDREAGALRRVAKVCQDAGLHFYHQTDPRGCALYVGTEPLTDQNYSTRGIPCL